MNNANNTKQEGLEGKDYPLGDEVLRQFDTNVHRIKPEVMLPIALLVRETGWEVKEILDLRVDRGLEQDEHGWWLRCNTAGRRRVPITKETAQALEAQRQRAAGGEIGAANTSRHVFVNCGKRGRGNPITPPQVRVALERLASECGITGRNGQVCYLTAGALRWGKYVELQGIGMDLVSIQQWMGDETVFATLKHLEGLRRQGLR